MATTKITKAKALEIVLNSVDFSAIPNGSEVKDVIDKMHTSAVNTQSNRKKATDKASAERIELATEILGYLENRTYACSEILTLIDGKVELGDNGSENSKRSKLNSILSAGVENNLFTVCTGYKVGGKGRAVNGYTPIITEQTATDDTATE